MGARGGCVTGSPLRVCGLFGGATTTTAVSGLSRSPEARRGGQEEPRGDCAMELEAVLKERGASARDPARVLGTWVKRGWPAGPADTELSSNSAAAAATTAAQTNRELEYEALPDGSNVTTHMLAGAVAGIMEHCLMYPVDCVKTRMQSLQPDPAARYRNVMEALFKIIRTEGFWRPMRGLNVTATGAGPAHALYFACYEKLKKTLSDVIRPGGNSHIANGIDDCCPA